MTDHGLAYSVLAQDMLVVHPEGRDELVPVKDMLSDPRQDIDTALARTAAYYFTVGQLRARVALAKNRADRYKSETFNTLANEVREELEKKGKTTEKAIEQAVRTHVEYLKACDHHNMMLFEEEQLTVLLKAIEMRLEAIRTIAVNQRREAGVAAMPQAPYMAHQ